MRLALAPINPTVGDFDGNAALMQRAVDAARARGCDLVVFPELCLSGYPPKDLLTQEGFVEAAARAAKRVGEEMTRGITVVFGVPLPVEAAASVTSAPPKPQGIANSLLAYREGAMLDYYDKRLLPTYDVFDEDRYFIAGDRAVVLDVAGVKVGLSICEDLWRGEDVGFSHRYADLPDPVEELVKAGARVIVNPSASPFVLGKSARHQELLARHARERGVWVAGVNQLGGNDDLVFDGTAAAFDPAGTCAARGRAFAEDLVVADLGAGASEAARALPPSASLGEVEPEALLFQALTLGVRDYCRKTGFKECLLGLSGGIDSALTCVIAAAALGRGNVLGVRLPSRYSSEHSLADAAELAERLGVRLITVPIEEPFVSMQGALKDAFAGRPADVTEENLQSRIRGTLMMALSNKFGAILLTTGNKSETAVGYATLYGDMNGGLAVLSDVSKQWVYRLSRWINDHHAGLHVGGTGGACFEPALARPPIPESSITKPPSAELRPNQTDQDSLPPYEVLDEIIERYVERRQSPARIAEETGFDGALVRKTTRMIDLAEYKRKQAATGIKVTGVAFGSGRRVPIAQRFRSV